MKKGVGISFAALVFGAALVLGGCATASSGTDRSDTASGTMETVETDIELTVENVEAANQGLEALIYPAQVDMTDAFEYYSERVDALAASRDAYMRHSVNMDQQGREYFEEWRVQNRTYVNPKIRALSEERRDEIGAVYAEIAESTIGLNELLDTHVSNLQEIRMYFSTDLTPAAAEVITPVARDVMAEGLVLIHALEGVLDSIGTVRYALATGDDR